MPLDNTSIKDHEGAALYVIAGHDTASFQKLDRLCTAVRSQCENQVVLVRHNDHDARALCDFYDISVNQLPAAMIVRDDDTLVELWHGEHIPFNPSDIAFRLRQVSS